ncbi:hypothetical protein GUJ93_ZPchr0009g2003 [Zizania palustris]|uniref:Late embryogenesis abundant protein LEA-2 subgroup domain-containing protein n=1 Tax=Zizania palustris TaxID=103762 RepID=A0A8J5VMF8_ZIZPA|nr:hypothetical protein GUJ93_ZPchr0009g2003 [Zizania palustris]
MDDPTSSSSSSRRRRGNGCDKSCHGQWPPPRPPHSAKCLCLYLVLSLTFFVLVAGVLLVVVFVTRLKKPTFSLQSVQMDRSFSLGLSAAAAATTNGSTTAGGGGGNNGTTTCSVASLLFAAENPT